jgi:hypothetical protein
LRNCTPAAPGKNTKIDSAFELRALVNSAEKSSWVGHTVYFFAENLAFECAFEVGQLILSGGIVRADQEHRFDLLLIHVRPIAAGVWSFCHEVKKNIRRAQFTGELRRTQAGEMKRPPTRSRADALGAPANRADECDAESARAS